MLTGYKAFHDFSGIHLYASSNVSLVDLGLLCQWECIYALTLASVYRSFITTVVSTSVSSPKLMYLFSNSIEPHFNNCLTAVTCNNTEGYCSYRFFVTAYINIHVYCAHHLLLCN